MSSPHTIAVSSFADQANAGGSRKHASGHHCHLRHARGRRQKTTGSPAYPLKTFKSISSSCTSRMSIRNCRYCTRRRSWTSTATGKSLDRLGLRFDVSWFVKGMEQVLVWPQIRRCQMHHHRQARRPASPGPSVSRLFSCLRCSRLLRDTQAPVRHPQSLVRCGPLATAIWGTQRPF